jgi:hypothetical protein
MSGVVGAGRLNIDAVPPAVRVRNRHCAPTAPKQWTDEFLHLARLSIPVKQFYCRCPMAFRLVEKFPPREGSAAICSSCHQMAPGYDQLAERRFEFIPLWGFFVNTTGGFRLRTFFEPSLHRTGRDCSPR